MILLAGPSGDSPLRAVASSLQRMGARYMSLDGNARVVKAWSPDSEAILNANGLDVPLGQVRSAYLRPVNLNNGDHEQRRALETLLGWADHSPAPVVNPPTASALNNSKPLQSQCIARFGLHVPETLVTTDPQAAREFALQHNEVIYKSVSGVRSIVRRLARERFPELDAVANCPTQFQHYIPGDDLRVHVIGESVHTLLIKSDADDYRYAARQGGHVEACEVELDLTTAALLRNMVRGMNLLLAGIDLRRTPSGDLYCLEVNPSPGFTYYEQLAHVDLASHIAALLAMPT